jgi:DMSO/TMAO reductase YedYZ molybdopterin-dependent catalytic subunit
MPENEKKQSIVILPKKKFTVDVDRRKFMGNSMSLGALTLLTGCDISDNDTVQKMFGQLARWNNFVQEELFSGTHLALEYPESMAVKDFRYNAWYHAPDAPVINGADYKLELAGLINDKIPWNVQRLYALPQKSQVTRHVCVEGWSMIGKWTGTPLRVFLERVGADLTAKYVGFVCADGYYESIDMPTALHPQTIMAFQLSDQVLPIEYGFPFKIRIPTKLGFKNPKFVTAIYVTNRNPGGFWVDRGYNWFSGI